MLAQISLNMRLKTTANSAAIKTISTGVINNINNINNKNNNNNNSNYNKNIKIKTTNTNRDRHSPETIPNYISRNTSKMPTSSKMFLSIFLAAIILGKNTALSDSDYLQQQQQRSGGTAAATAMRAMLHYNNTAITNSTKLSTLLTQNTKAVINNMPSSLSLTLIETTTTASAVAAATTTNPISSTTSSQTTTAATSIIRDNTISLSAIFSLSAASITTTRITTTAAGAAAAAGKTRATIKSETIANTNRTNSNPATLLTPPPPPPIDAIDFTLDENNTDSVYTDSIAVADADADANDSLTLLLPSLPSDSLTKGFSIPTFLPPFPEFAMADLPSYASAAAAEAAAAAAAAAASTITTQTPPNAYLNEIAVGVGGGDVVHASLSSDMLLPNQQDQLYLAAYNKHQQQHIAKRNLTMPSTNLTVQVGNHAYMPCHIRRLMNKPVSWVRVRDGHILSVDQTTFIADQRFQSIFQGENEYTWSLQIKYVQDNDEGWYECQVSTEPKMSAKVYLSVVVPKTELIGDQNRFVKAGSKVALHCIVRGTLDPPTYIIWFRGKMQISDDNKMGWYTQIDRTIFGNASDNQNTIGSLIIPFVRKKDSGNYTCQPSNSAAVSVDLHVLSGEYSASAIMSAARSYKLNTNSNYLLLLIFLVALQRT